MNVCISFFIGVLAAQSDCCHITKVSMTPYSDYLGYPPVLGCHPGYSPYWPIGSSACTTLPSYQELAPRLTRTTTLQRYYRSPVKSYSSTFHHCRDIPPTVCPTVCHHCHHIPPTVCHHCHHAPAKTTCTTPQHHQCTSNGSQKPCCCCSHGPSIPLDEPCYP